MWTAFSVTALSTLVALAAVLYAKYWNLYRKSLQFPGPPAWPLIGNALEFFRVPPEAIINISLEYGVKYGNTIRFWLGPKLNVVMQNVEDIGLVLASNTLISKSDEYSYLSVWLRDGLLLSRGRKWAQRRKLITPAFHFKVLEQFIEVFQEQSAILVHQMQTAGSEERPIDMYQLISLCSLDVICETAMGVKINAQTNANSTYVQAVKSISKVLHKRMSDPRYVLDIFYMFTKLAQEGKQALAVLHGFTEQIIIQRRAELVCTQQQQNQHQQCAVDEETLKRTKEDERSMGIKPKNAFLDILLQSEVEGKPLTNMDIREEVDTFMFEGHDTTASAIMFFFYNIAINAECQQKCYAEISKVFDEDPTQPVSYESLSKLHYVELCIKETLRLFPPVPIIGRKVLKDCNINGRIVPAGANIGMSAFHLGRQAQLFPEPDRFKPERFDVVINAEKINPYAYIPFSAGPRNCIGQKFAMLEIKSVAANVLRHFEIEYVGDAQRQPVLVAELILRTKYPLMFKIKKRF